MASSTIPTFAVGEYSKIQSAITSGVLKYPSYVFCTDTNTMVFIDKNQQIQNLKGYNQDSVIIVDTLPEDDIRSDAFYICNGTGYLYINGSPIPVFKDITETQNEVQALIDATKTDLQTYVDEKVATVKTVKSYNELEDLPITNLHGEVGNTIVLADLENGCYSITGQYQIGGSIDTIYITAKKTIFLVDSDVDNKYITKFGTGEIVLYTIDSATNNGIVNNYVTQAWIAKQGYTNEDYVTQAINDLYQRLVEELLITKVSQLENDAGYLTASDINGIGDGDISGLFNIKKYYQSN